jgi:predicted MFS family arabinose efflux permease
MFKSMSKDQCKALIVAAALMFAYGMVNSTIGYFITPVTVDLGYSQTSFTLYYTIMSLVGMAVAPVIGQLIQRWGTRRIILIGCIWCTAGLAGFSLAHRLWIFYLLAAYMGLFQAGCTSIVAVVIINRWFPGKNGTPMGFAMAGTGIASLTMSLILPSFIQRNGWRPAYLLQAACWLALTSLCIWLTKDGTDRTAGGGNADEKETETFSEGVFFRDAIRSARLYFFMLAIFLIAVSTCFINLMPSHFISLGMPTAVYGAIMSLFSVVLIFCKIGLGTLCDKIGQTRAIPLVLGSYVFAFFLMFSKNIVLLCIGSAMLAFGMSSGTVLPPLLARSLFGQRELPAIWSVASMSLNIGVAVGSPAWGAVYDMTGSYHLGIIVAPILLSGAAAMLLMLLRSGKKSVFNS